ncbi:lipopolysaccharide heptosyltransferase II [Craterilacuibacter sp.]|uniref:lipopolysaccharide heptosyltransferase II n=1 Tax=Craterilacuibacter sp. TaxID=2870909 RepID=UPI003F3CA1DF
MKKILVIGPSWVGDGVMAQPLYRRLLERNPGAEVHVFAPVWTMPLLARMPEVARAHLNPFGHGQLQLGERWRVARELATEKFDQAIILPGSIKSALIPFMAGIPKRTGFTGEMRYGLVNDMRALDEKALPKMIERFCALAEAPAVAPELPIAHPRLAFNSETGQASAMRLGLDLSRPVVVMCPGAEYGPAKRWPARHFAALSRAFADAGWHVWLFGSAKDSEIGHAICEQAGGAATNLCGATGLEEAIDLMGFASLAVCNDSGLMHIAAALGIPLVALYGSSSPGFTPPLSDKAAIVTLSLDCSPCFERVCPLKHTNCLEKMQAERVWQAAQQLLERHPPVPDAS